MWHMLATWLIVAGAVGLLWQAAELADWLLGRMANNGRR